MVKKLAERIAVHYVQKNTISSDEFEVYAYGFELLLSAALNLVLVAITAIIFNIPLQAAIFVLAFILIRAFGGGYHAKTHKGCVWAFFAIFASFSLLLHLLPTFAIGVYVLTTAFTSCVFIWIAAPVEAKNKPLSIAKQTRLKKCCRVIALLLCIFAIWNFFHPFPFGQVLAFAYSGGVAASTSIAFAALMNKIRIWKSSDNFSEE